MTLKESLEYDPVELLFGTSGLRGLVHDMTDLECYINTAGFIRFLEKNKQLKLNSTVSIAGDLRHSTPEILRAVATAIKDYGYQVNYCGYIPTPALALWGLNNGQAVIMITGSHIPEDRNGIKFYKPDGEVLKEDESAIKESVSITRNEFYSTPAQQSWFDTKGRLTKAIQVGEINRKAELGYLKRFQSIFSPRLLTGKHIVVYQHSAVGRDLLVKILEYFGAKVTAVLRSEKFIPVDSENITPEFQNIFRKLSQEYPDRFAIVSTDGDSDRPIVVDEKGVFHRGDILGAIVAQTLSADFAAYPISSSDAVDKHLASKGIIYEHTKIGSPYVIKAMQRAGNNGHTAIVGWEVNGGFLTGSNLTKNGLTLSPLPTRDAFLPILVILEAAISENKPLSRLFSELPPRFTQAGLVDNFPIKDSQRVIERLSKSGRDTHTLIKRSFTEKNGFNTIKSIDTTDGVRLTFENGDIAHIRPSGNAPQLRIYSVAATQERADEIVSLGVKKDGILEKLQKLSM